MSMSLKALPPQMRKQALKKIAEEDARRAASLKAVERATRAKQKAAGEDFDSHGEYEYFMSVVRPKIRSGDITACQCHPEFELFPAGEFDGEKLKPIRYTSDFKLEYADGSVEVVEVKSKFVKKMQRDYHIRRRIFIEKYARPNGWKFTEVITQDSREGIKEWRRIQHG